MLKTKALLLTQGMHGMISQVEGLSKALGLKFKHCLLYTSPSPRDLSTSRMPSSA